MAYKCEIRLKCFMGIREANKLVEQCGFDKKVGFEYNFICATTMPEIPNKKFLDNIVKIFKGSFNEVAEKENSKYNILSCEFDGYKSLEQVEDKPETDNAPETNETQTKIS